MRSHRNFRGFIANKSLRTIGLICLIGVFIAFTAKTTPQKLSKKYQKWVYEMVRYIITPEERESFLRLPTDEQREQFIKEFWRKRDPNRRTKENEFQKEYLKRVEFANKYFSTSLRAGMDTDRGMIYILFGTPAEIEQNPSGEGGHPTEIWIYREEVHNKMLRSFEIRFIDLQTMGDYILATDLKELNKALVDFENPRILVKNPGLLLESFKSIYSLETLAYPPWVPLIDALYLEGVSSLEDPVSIQEFAHLESLPETYYGQRFYIPSSLPLSSSIIKADFFRSLRNRVRMPITICLPLEELLHKKGESRKEALIEVIASLRRNGSPQTIMAANRISLSLGPEVLDKLNQDRVNFQLCFLPLPASYMLELFIKDKLSDKWYTYREELIVPHFHDSKLDISSLVLSNQVQILPPSMVPISRTFLPYLFENIKIVPNLRRIFSPQGKLSLFYYIYNLSLETGTGKNNLAIEYSFYKDNRLYKRIPARYPPPTPQPTRVILNTFKLNGFSPGSYTLRLRATDLVSNQRISRIISFELR